MKTCLILLLTFWTLTLAISRPEQQRSTIDVTKVTKWTGTDNVVAFTLTVLASQIIVATGWIIAGKKKKLYSFWI